MDEVNENFPEPILGQLIYLNDDGTEKRRIPDAGQALDDDGFGVHRHGTQKYLTYDRPQIDGKSAKSFQPVGKEPVPLTQHDENDERHRWLLPDGFDPKG